MSETPAASSPKAMVRTDENWTSPGLIRWAGPVLLAGGVLQVVATLLHPSHETVRTIIASETSLVAAYSLYTLAYLLVLLGLPGLYAAQRGQMGRLGVVGFLGAFLGTYLIAVTGNFGFLAPVLAKEAPAVLDSINQYQPLIVVNGLAGVAFIIGYAVFWHRYDQDGDDTATIRRACRRGWLPSPSGFRNGTTCVTGPVTGRRSGQRKPRRRPGCPATGSGIRRRQLRDHFATGEVEQRRRLAGRRGAHVPGSLRLGSLSDAGRSGCRWLHCDGADPRVNNV